MFSQFEGAEILAEKYDLTRAEMEDFALASHQKAAAATDAGHFKVRWWWWGVSGRAGAYTYKSVPYPSLPHTLNHGKDRPCIHLPS